MCQKGFSFIELLVVLAILPVLTLMSVKLYNDQKKQAYRTSARSSMTDLMTLMKTAKENDGYYHQFIYQMGYRPKGVLMANLGLKTDNSAPCGSSNPLPSLGASNCSKEKAGSMTYKIRKGAICPEGTKAQSGDFEGSFCKNSCVCQSAKAYEVYRYYKCDDSPLGKATDSRTICNATSYTSKCFFKKKPAPRITSSTDFGTCNSQAVCHQNKVGLGAISKAFEEKMVLHSSGKFCVD